MASSEALGSSVASQLMDPVVKRQEKVDHAKKHGKTKTSAHDFWCDHNTAWDKMNTLSHNNKKIFDSVEIADDGGISEIELQGSHLWSHARYYSAVIMVVFVVYNVGYVAWNDISMIRAGEEHTNYLISSWFISKVTGKNVATFSHTIIAIIELVFLCVTLSKVILRTFQMCCSSEFRKWNATAGFFWDNIPDLSYFSAMQLLHYVTSAVVSENISFALFYAPQGRKWFLVTWFILRIPLCLVIGLDCFIIKYRMVSEYIMTDEMSWMNLMEAFVLLNQVLGVVQIRWAVRNRLFRFVFGGEDGIMTEKELVRMNIWNALIAKEIFKVYPWNQALAIMLSWSTDDFQLLVLNDTHLHRLKVLAK